MKVLTAGLLFILLMSTASAAALEVDEEELAEGRDGPVEFINYEGPHEIINTRDQIRGIGIFLGNAVVEAGRPYGFQGKYTVIHAVDPDKNGLLDADIFIIEKTAQVDHIRNLRSMIGAYLETYYEYNREDAALLAEFITIYNAVFRGNMDYVKTKYNELVISYLVPEKIGMAKVYSEWPGKTMILIPLSEFAEKGRLASLQSDELTEDQVIEEMRTEEDMGIDERRGMVELKEREVVETRQEIAEERQQLDQREQDLLQQQEEIQQEREQPEEAGVERVPADIRTGEDQGVAAAVDRTPADIRTEEEQSIEAELERIDEQRQELDQQEQAQEERVERIQEERATIVEDTRTLLAEQGEETAGITEIISEEGGERPGTAAVESTLFLKVQEVSGEILGTLVSVNLKNGEVIRESNLNAVRQRWFSEEGDKVIVLAGREGRGGAVRLIVLDAETLEMEIQGEDELYIDSAVVIDGTDIYAVINTDGEYKLGRFNRDLARQAQSELLIDPLTAILVKNGNVFVQDTQGKVRILTSSNLKEAAQE